MRAVATLMRGFASGAATTAPASPTLAVADNGDGSGATATISGAGGDVTLTIYVLPFDGLEVEGATWRSCGSRASNGTLNLTLSTGHYFGYALAVDSGGGAASNVVYFSVTSGGESVLFQCLQSAQARIQAILLPGLTSGNVIVRKLPLDRYVGSGQPTTFPAILLTPVVERMPPLSGTVNFDDVTYGVLCTIVDRDNQEPTLAANLPRYTLWREKIARAFRNQRLAGVVLADGSNPIINAEVDPGEQLIPAAWSANLYASALLLRFVSREPRGIS